MATGNKRAGNSKRSQRKAASRARRGKTDNHVRRPRKMTAFERRMAINRLRWTEVAGRRVVRVLTAAEESELTRLLNSLKLPVYIV